MQIIISHVGTDFDGFASMALAAKLYPGAHMVFPGRLGTGVEEFYALHRHFFPVLPLKTALEGPIERIVVVDTRLASRLGPFREHLQNPRIELHVYDHHPPNAEAVRGDQEWVEPVGAAATLLVERCRQESLQLIPEEATLALIAIHEETGSFRYSSTTARDLAAAAFLMEGGANLEVLGHFLRDPLSRDQRELLEQFLSGGELVQGASGTMYLASAERSKSVFGLGLLASRVLEVQGADAVCAVLSVNGKETSIAARAGSDVFDMAGWMQNWGGGGHRRAAAASKIEEPLVEICLKLKDLAQRGEAKSTLVASDIMSTEVFSLARHLTVDQASEALRGSGHQAACIVDDEGAIVGLVSRSDLEKALDHRLGHAPATSVMTHKVVSVTSTMPVAEVRRMVVQRAVGTIPVLDEGRLVGIISRSDLLRDMYHRSEEEADFRSGIGPQELDLGSTPRPFRDWLDVVEELAEAARLRVYAVGGFVRDTLLKRKTEDLDLVVEGDAEELARGLAARFGGKVTVHEKYMTVTVRFPDKGGKLDIATARREVYCRPAALPEVAQSNLKSDLYRRDFSINCLAIRLGSGRKGAVIDFFGGQADLEAGLVRVLHNHSFFDDPSRIFRAIRFEQRLGFTIEPSTRQLMQAALEAGALALTRPERLREELRLSMSESDPVKVLARLEQLKVLGRLHPDLKFKGKVQERTERALEFVERHPQLVPRERIWEIPMLLLGADLSSETTADLRERFDWKFVQWPWPFTPMLGRLCRHEMAPSEIARLLDALGPVTLAVFAGLSPHVTFQERVERYVLEHRHARPLLDGNDVMAAGVALGRDVSQWKNAALDAQRDGAFNGREGALAWLRDALVAAAGAP